MIGNWQHYIFMGRGYQKEKLPKHPESQKERKNSCCLFYKTSWPGELQYISIFKESCKSGVPCLYLAKPILMVQDLCSESFQRQCIHFSAVVCNDDFSVAFPNFVLIWFIWEFGRNSYSTSVFQAIMAKCYFHHIGGNIKMLFKNVPHGASSSF